MRLKHSYCLLTEAYNSLQEIQHIKTVSIKHIIFGEKNTYFLPNSAKLISDLDNLKKIAVLSRYADSLLHLINDASYDDDDECIYLSEEENTDFEDTLYSLKNKIELLIKFCDELNLVSKTSGFDVKMPPTQDLNEFSENINLLSKAISQCPYLVSDTEKIILNKTDIGSIWFEFAVNSAIASGILFNFAVIIDKCVKVASHILVLKEQEEEYRSVKLKNELLKDLIDNNKKITAALIDTQIKQLQEELPNVQLKGDDIERVRFSLETIVNLMDKGMEFYASIDSPQEIKDLFPTSDELNFLPNKKEKLLKEKNSQQ